MAMLARRLASRLLPRRGARRSLATMELDELPAVDIGGLLEGAPESRRRAAHRALASALLEEDSPGFFYAQHAPATLDAAYLESVYAFVDQAHALEPHVKYPFADPDRGSGELGVAYNGPDVGHLEPSYDGESVSAACAWDYSPHGVARQAPGWDRHLPRRFAATFADLYGRQNAVGRAVLGALAEVLGLPRDTFAHSFDAGDLGTIRLISYPGADDGGGRHTFTAADASSGDHAWTYRDDDDDILDADVGIAPHTDFEAFTFMHQDAPGLQLLARPELDKGPDAAWFDAPVSDDFVIIVGDVLERYTNGVLRATPHRVVRRAAPRRSIIRFNAVAPDAVVAPLPHFTRDAPPKYSPVTMQTHMDTTLGNLRRGVGSWDPATNTSRSATYDYSERHGGVRSP